jgi:hypothetical protein
MLPTRSRRTEVDRVWKQGSGQHSARRHARSAQANVCALAAPPLTDGQDTPKRIVTVVDRILGWDDVHRALNNTDWSLLAYGPYRRFAHVHFDPRQSVPGAPWSAWPLADLLAAMARKANVENNHLFDEVVGVALRLLWQYGYSFDPQRAKAVLGWLETLVRTSKSAVFRRLQTKENAFGQPPLELALMDVDGLGDDEEPGELPADLLHLEQAFSARCLAERALPEATVRELEAVEKAQAGLVLSNADHQSLYRLRAKLSKKGLTEQYEEIMDQGWLPPRTATGREHGSNIGQNMLVPRQNPTPSRQADLIEVAHAGPVRLAKVPGAALLLQPVRDACDLADEPATAAQRAVA